MNEPRYRERPTENIVGQAYAARFTGPGSRAHIQEIARCCDAEAAVVYIERWNTMMVRWSFVSERGSRLVYTALREGEWLVYHVGNDAMGELTDAQFKSTYELIR